MLMRARHRLAYNDKDTFGVFTSDAINKFVQAVFGLVAAVALGVVSISLVVGGIVIMNIMLVTVTERTREIGIRKSRRAAQGHSDAVPRRVDYALTDRRADRPGRRVWHLDDPGQIHADPGGVAAGPPRWRSAYRAASG